MQQVFYWGFLKIVKFWISVFFVGDVLSGIGLGPVYQALGTNTKSQFLTHVFSGIFVLFNSNRLSNLFIR